MEIKYICYIKFKHCNDSVVVSFISEKRVCCVVVCSKVVCSLCVLRLMDEYMLYSL